MPKVHSDGTSLPRSVHFNQSEPDLGTDVSLVWNFCTGSSNIILWGNECWHYKMVAVFSGNSFTICKQIGYVIKVREVCQALKKPKLPPTTP